MKLHNKQSIFRGKITFGWDVVLSNIVIHTFRQFKYSYAEYPTNSAQSFSSEEKSSKPQRAEDSAS